MCEAFARRFRRVKYYVHTICAERPWGIVFLRLVIPRRLLWHIRHLRKCGKRTSLRSEPISARYIGAAYGFSEDYLANLLGKKPTAPEDFAYYMDHAYFSTVRLYRGMESFLTGDANEADPSFKFNLGSAHVDSLSAILLHYVVFRYSIAPCAGEAGPCLQKGPPLETRRNSTARRMS